MTTSPLASRVRQELRGLSQSAGVGVSLADRHLLDDPVELSVIMRDIGSLGVKSVWLHDLAWDGGGCAFTLAALIAPSWDGAIGVWIHADDDHPLRFVEEFSVVDRLTDGRLMIGACEPLEDQWIEAVARGFRHQPVEWTLSGAEGPLNEHIQDGWHARVFPEPVGGEPVWVAAPGIDLATASRPVRLDERSGFHFVLPVLTS